jgi:hypothetical protein
MLITQAIVFRVAIEEKQMMVESEASLDFFHEGSWHFTHDVVLYK